MGKEEERIKMFLAACVQMSSDTRVKANLDRAESYIRRAASRGAKLVILPRILHSSAPKDSIKLNALNHSMAQRQQDFQNWQRS